MSIIYSVNSLKKSWYKPQIIPRTICNVTRASSIAKAIKSSKRVTKNNRLPRAPFRYTKKYVLNNQILSIKIKYPYITGNPHSTKIKNISLFSTEKICVNTRKIHQGHKIKIQIASSYDSNFILAKRVQIRINSS